MGTTPECFEVGSSHQKWGKQTYFHSLPKVDLQIFEGCNPRSWVRKCQKYIDIYHIPANQNLELAAMHLDGKADI